MRNKDLFSFPVFKESMANNKKQAMIVGTYHLFLDSVGWERIKNVIGRMKDFATAAPTEVRFELELGFPGVAENLTDAFMHSEVRKVVKSSKGLDTDTNKMVKQLQTVMGKLQGIIVEAASVLGFTAVDLQMAQMQLYTPQLIDSILSAIDSQDFAEVDRELQTIKSLDAILGKTAKLNNREFSPAAIPSELTSEYDKALDAVGKIILQRDRKWVFPTSDRVLICVGYEHTKFVKDIYRKKGYKILT